MESTTDENIKDDKLASLSPREKEMATANIPKLILSYSIPTVIGMLVAALYVVVDRIFVGRIPYIGNDALNGVGLAAPISLILAAFALLVGVGSAANISIRMGRRDIEGAEKVLGNCFTLTIVLSIVLGIVALFALEPLLIAFGASEATLPFADTYTRIKIYGIIFTYISLAMNHPIRGMGFAKRFAAAQLFGALLNIALNPLFIFTFNMGVAGAAWSTVLTHFIVAVYIMAFYAKGNGPVKLRLKNIKPETKVILAIASIGIAPFLMQILGSGVNIIANRHLIQLGGDAAVGALTAIMGVISLFVMPVFGIAQGSQPIIGFNYGMGNGDRVRKAYLSSATYAVIIAFVGAVLIVAFPTFIMGMFSSDYDILSIGAVGMRIMAWTMPVAAFQMNASTFFMAIGRAKMSVLLSVLRQGIILVPLYFILPNFMGILGIWWAMPMADLAAFAVTLFVILRELRMIKRRFANV
ncbi:MAG: MATE family efflux transporter [Defluviitaleaceae bacterium]|nr:MATE family efflux transporter [Defluviitaleaceae bacterium]